MTDCIGSPTPGVMGVLITERGEPVCCEMYRRAIGKLLYVSTRSRPDISFIVGCLSKFCNDPTTVQWTAVKRLIAYLKHTLDYRLVFSKVSNLNLEVYCDADWSNDRENSKSVGGYIALLGGTAISWRSKKQDIVATITMLAEYYALFEASKEVIWLRDLMKELRHPIEIPTNILADNQGANSLADSYKLTERNKHSRIRYHFVRDCVSDKLVCVCYVPSSENIADLLTKLLPQSKTLTCTKGMGLSA
ncbi:secreted RxLR effector protein 161-like [Ischnura elegans]|uniref:secreted RxLR effector protein 161-like n=1 Tax=Ischnura elegans TaxID=197161 RepID=UPI001ED87909|nr:secreted RxLR effector protein 161-like [Ischnura elegans]